MGALTSRQNAGVEEVDIPSTSVYRYPPKSGRCLFPIDDSSLTGANPFNPKHIPGQPISAFSVWEKRRRDILLGYYKAYLLIFG